MRLTLKSSSMLLVLALGIGGLIGCASTTETGYEPRRLGMSEGQLKGLYAPAFTPEAREAETGAESSAARKEAPVR